MPDVVSSPVDPIGVYKPVLINYENEIYDECARVGLDDDLHEGGGAGAAKTGGRHVCSVTGGADEHSDQFGQ